MPAYTRAMPGIYGTESLFLKRHDTRIIAAIRWLIASTALTIIWLDPGQPDNELPWLTYSLLSLYTLYSTTIYFLSIKRNRWLNSVELWEHWIDVAWFTVLISLCTGTNRIFFFGFIFATLVASFRRGFAAGLSVVTVSIFSHTIIGYSTETADYGFSSYGFDVYHFMLRPVYLLVLGYMMAYWGGYELMLKRRLALLKDVTLSNPRFGVDRTIYSMLGRLRDFYDADEGLLLIRDSRAQGDVLYRVESEGAQAIAHPETITEELATRLLALPPRLAVCYNSRHNCCAYDLEREVHFDEGREDAAALAATLDASAFITVPVTRHTSVVGRMYFSRRQRRAFDASDVFFLAQVLEHAGPIIENVRLVDRLASDAAEQERQRIARDIHDSVIQPYIGFQIGLSGVRRKLASGHADIGTDIERLLEMTDVGIGDLRRYIKGLHDRREHGNDFRTMVKRFTEKFAEATGINVSLVAPEEIIINDGLAAEVFQMVAEGLSNIRRHTESAHAVIKVECVGGKLLLSIENGRDIRDARVSFVPRSITERAASLGGVARVDTDVDGNTIVRVQIPM
jgi:signal transduction histidine kinase